MVVKFIASSTGRLLPTRKISGTHFCYRLRQFQGYGAAGRIGSIENPMNFLGI
jgi:hypothetical protein